MDLEDYLRRKAVWYGFVEKKETIHTADAASAARIELGRVTKNLVSKTDSGEYVLLVVPGDRRVDLKKAAKALGAKNVTLVPFDEVEEVSGYPPGGTPTIGHRTPMKILMEKALLEHDVIYCGGGRRDRLLALRLQEVLRAEDVVVAEIAG